MRRAPNQKQLTFAVVAKRRLEVSGRTETQSDF